MIKSKPIQHRRAYSSVGSVGDQKNDRNPFKRVGAGGGAPPQKKRSLACVVQRLQELAIVYPRGGIIGWRRIAGRQ